MVFSQDGVGLYLGQENTVRVLWGRFFKRNFSGFSLLLYFIWVCDLTSIQGNTLKRSLQPIGERRTSSDEDGMSFCQSKWYIEMMQASKWVFNTKTLLIVPDTVWKCEFNTLGSEVIVECTTSGRGKRPNRAFTRTIRANLTRARVRRAVLSFVLWCRSCEDSVRISRNIPSRTRLSWDIALFSTWEIVVCKMVKSLSTCGRILNRGSDNLLGWVYSHFSSL